jgi:plasmid replication initiation protein
LNYHLGCVSLDNLSNISHDSYMAKVLKPNGLTFSNSRLSLNERKLWHFLVWKAQKKLDKHQYHEVSCKELYSYMGWTSRNDTYIKKMFVNVCKCTITWVGMHKTDKWTTASILASARMTGTHIEYEFARYVERRILNKEQFSLVNLGEVVSANSKTQLLIYEFFEQYKNMGHTPFFSVDDLKKKWECEKKTYDNFKYLNLRILKPAQERFCKNLGWICEIEQRRTGSHVTHLRFKFRKMTAKEKIEEGMKQTQTAPLL